MTTLGRAYIEIVADGSGFSASLRDEVGKQLDSELSSAADKAGRKAGRKAGKGMSDGIKESGDDVKKSSEDVGAKAGDGLTSGIKKTKAVAPDVIDRVKVLKKVQRIGEDISRTLTKSALDESRRSGVEVDFTRLHDQVDRETKLAVGKLLSGMKKEAEGKKLDFNLDFSEMERAASNAGHRVMTGMSAAMIRERQTASRALEHAGKDLTSKAGKIGDDAGKSLSTKFRLALAGVTFGFSEFAGLFRKIGPAVAKFGAIAIGASYGVVALGEALLTAAPAALSLGASLVQLSGLALGLPAALGPLVLAAIATKFAFQGLGTAMAATDGKQFAEATKNMGAATRKLAGTLRDLMPVFRSIQQGAQDAFASQVLTNIRAVTAEVAGPLRSGFAALGHDIGAAASTMLGFLGSAKGITLLGQWFGTANIGLQSITSGLTALLTGFANLNTAVKPIIDGLAGAVGGLETRFGNWLTQISATGKAAQWLQGALNTLSTLADVARNFGDILLRAWEASGGQAKVFLDTVDILIGHFDAFLATAQGASALTNFFTGIAQVANVLQPLLDAVAGSIGQIALPVADLVASLAPGLTALAKALGPMLAALGKALLPIGDALSRVVILAGPALVGFATALQPLGDALGGLLVALAPLLPILLKVVGTLAQELAPIIAIIGPALEPVIKAFGELVDVMAPFAVEMGPKLAALLLPILQQLSTELLALLPAFAQLAPVIAADLMPAIDALVQLLPQILPPFLELIPLVLQLMPTFLELAVAMAPVVKSLADLTIALLPLINLMVRAIVAVAGWEILNVITPLIKGLAFAVQIAAENFTAVVKAVTAAIKWITSLDWGAIGKAIGGAFADAWKAVVNFFEGIGKWFADLPGKIGGWLSGTGSAIGGFFETLPGLLAGWLSAAGKAIVDFFTSLPGLVATLIQNWFDGMLFAIGAGIALLVGVFIVLPPKILAWLADMTVKAVAWAVDFSRQLAKWIGDGIDAVIQFFIDLPGRMWNAIKDIGKNLGDFFTGLWRDTTKIVSDWLDALVDFFVKLPGRLWNAYVSISVTLHNFFAGLWTDTVRIVTNWFNAIVDFFVKLPGRLMSGISSVAGSLGAFFTKLWTDTKNTVKNLADDVVGFFSGLPGRITSGLRSLASAAKGPINDLGSALYGIVNKIIDGFNSVIGHFDSKLSISHITWHDFHTGGIVPGTGDRDTVPAMLTPGEGVLTKRATARLGGRRGIEAINKYGVANYGVGGIIGGIADAASSGWAKALGIGKDILRILTDPAGFLRDIENSIPGFSKFANSNFGQALAQIPHNILDAVVNKIKSSVDGVKNLYDKAGNLVSKAGGVIGGIASGVAGLFGGGNAGSTGAGNDQLGKWIDQAVALAGVPASWGPRLRVGIIRESGGNPRAINLTDINAVLGHPSIGLMQTIGPTFEAYRLKSLPDNIYDPIANIVAGIRYILARYGSIFNVQQFNPSLPPRGYAAGVLINQPTIARLGEAGPELVLPLSRPDRMAQLLRNNVLDVPSGRGAITGASVAGASTVINAPITLTAPQSDPELVAWKVTSQIARMAASGVG